MPKPKPGAKLPSPSSRPASPRAAPSRPLGAGDLGAAAGLGFAAEAAGCALSGVPSIATADGVAACLAVQHACRAEALVGAEIPRARALMALAGRDPAVETPCLPPGGSGGAVADVKLVLKCQKGFAKAGASYATARLKSAQKCLDAKFACTQLKPSDAACLTKAGTTCTKLATKVTAAATKVHAALGKACGALDFATACSAQAASASISAPASAPPSASPRPHSMPSRAASSRTTTAASIS